MVIPICLQIFPTETGPQNWKYLLSDPLQKKFAEPCSRVKGGNHVAQGDAETYRVEMSFQKSPCFLLKNIFIYSFVWLHQVLQHLGHSGSFTAVHRLSCSIEFEDLNYLPGDWTHVPCIARRILFFFFLIYIFYCNVSGAQQGDSVTHILFFKLFSVIGYYKILTIVLCAIQ